MPINSTSTPVQYKEYVNPMDLNIFASVMQYQQQKFDAGAQAVQSKIDGFSSLDVLADTDREYLNSKVQETLKGINNLGGADLSDSSVTRQLSSYVGNIGNDERVVNAVLDTKKVRAMQAGRAQINKDFNAGKKGVNRSDANEAVENEAVSKYLQAKKTDPTARYDGPSSPIAYSDYHKRIADAAKSIKASAVMSFSPTANKYLYMLEGTKGVTEEQIWQMAQNALTEEDRGQMARDAKYHYKNASDEQILSEYTAVNQRNINRINAQLKDIETRSGVESTEAKIQLLKQRTQLMADNDQRKADMKSILTKDRESAIGQLFMNRYMEGAAARYSYKEQQLKPVWNQGQMHVDRLTQQAMIANRDQANKDRDYAFKVDKEAWDRTHTKDKTEDGKDIETNSFGSYTAPSNSKEVEPNTVSVLKTQNTELATAKDQLTQSLWDEYAIAHDHNKTMFRWEKGHAVPNDSFIEANKALYQSATDMANGRPAAINSLPVEFVRYREGRKAIEFQQKANQEKIDAIRTRALDNTEATVKANKTISDAEWQTYKRGKAIADRLPSTDVTTSLNAVGPGGTVLPSYKQPNQENGASKLNKSDKADYDAYMKYKNKVNPIYDKELKAVESDASNRINAIGTTFTNKQLESKGLMASVILQNNGYFTTDVNDGIQTRPEDKNPVLTRDNFQAQGMIKRNLDGTGERNYVQGTLTQEIDGVKTSSRVYIPMDAAASAKFAPFTNGPSKHIEQALETSPTHEIIDQSYGMPSGGRINSVVDFKVMRLAPNRFKLSIKQPYDEKGIALPEPVWVNIPHEFTTGAEAHENGKQLASKYQINRAELKKKNINLHFKDYVENLAR